MPVDAAARGAARRLEQLRRALEAEMIRILRELEEDDRGLVSSRENLRNAVAVRAQVLAVLRDAGVQVVEEEVERAAAEVAREVLSFYDPATVEGFAPNALNNVESILRGQIGQLSTVWDEAADTLRLAIDRAVVTGAPLEDLIERVQGALDGTFAQAESVVNSAIMGTLRATTLEMAEAANDGELVYFYTGPDDGKTRPFCDQHRGKAYSKAALDALNNGVGQPKPVSAFLGGYNCRHSLSPMTIEDAREEGIEVVL